MSTEESQMRPKSDIWYANKVSRQSKSRFVNFSRKCFNHFLVLLHCFLFLQLNHLRFKLVGVVVFIYRFSSKNIFSMFILLNFSLHARLHDLFENSFQINFKNRTTRACLVQKRHLNKNRINLWNMNYTSFIHYSSRTVLHTDTK